MKKLIKKTKQTFGKDSESDNESEKKSMEPEIEFA